MAISHCRLSCAFGAPGTVDRFCWSEDLISVRLIRIRMTELNADHIQIE